MNLNVPNYCTCVSSRLLARTNECVKRQTDSVTLPGRQRKVTARRFNTETVVYYFFNFVRQTMQRNSEGEPTPFSK